MEWEGPFVKGQTRIIWVCLIFYEIFQKCRSGTFHRKEMEKSMEQLLQVGVITQTHGIRGEVKVFPTTDDPARFERLRKVVHNAFHLFKLCMKPYTMDNKTSVHI